MEIKPLEGWQVDAACEIYRMNNRKKNVQDFRIWLLESIDPHNGRKYLGADEFGFLQGFVGFGKSALKHGVYDLFHLNVSAETQIRDVSVHLVKQTLKEIHTNGDARLIQVCTKDPRFYRERFGFEEMCSFDHGNAYLLGLVLRSEKQNKNNKS